jgi:hypothetical protein
MYDHVKGHWQGTGGTLSKLFYSMAIAASVVGRSASEKNIQMASQANGMQKEGSGKRHNKWRFVRMS